MLHQTECTIFKEICSSWETNLLDSRLSKEVVQNDFGTFALAF